ncbi:gag-Pol polyprotein [Caerostris extrusa]|uniref:Gag-Pol polyprotein n=1 Tax=Caerostris extrusa TaxID=172846 RepID=A0AAV4TMA6_CAEEX|nr:gag-Pol polyprotein [Caerostris extrusa]
MEERKSGKKVYLVSLGVLISALSRSGVRGGGGRCGVEEMPGWEGRKSKLNTSLLFPCKLVELKNRDFNARLAFLAGDEHDNWHLKLPVIRFAMNTAFSDTTGHMPAFLQFGREFIENQYVALTG